MIIARPRMRFAFSHPAHFIALGFGAGLSPFAPGTAGTLVAFPLWWLLRDLGEPLLLLGLIAGLYALGVWACSVTGRHLGISDHGSSPCCRVAGEQSGGADTPLVREIRERSELLVRASRQRRLLA